MLLVIAKQRVSLLQAFRLEQAILFHKLGSVQNIVSRGIDIFSVKAAAALRKLGCAGSD